MPDINTLGNDKLTPTPTAITSGASPTDADPNARFVAITTGGTAGVEVINLPIPTLTLDGWSNPGLVGQRITFCLVVQTDPADVVKITVDGSENINAVGFDGRFQTTSTGTGAKLDYVGGAISFVWCHDVWKIDAQATDENDSTDWKATRVKIEIPTSAGNEGGAIELNAGDVTDTNYGGAIRFVAGASSGGIGGTVSIDGGAGTSGSGERGNDHGDIIIAGDGGLIYMGLPTTDPHRADALWNNGGVLSVSAG